MQVIMEEVEEVLHNFQIDDEDDDADKSEDVHAAIDHPYPNQPGCTGVDQLMNQLDDMNDQLLCRDTQVLVGSEYKALCSSFEVFEKKVASSGSECQVQAV